MNISDSCAKLRETSSVDDFDRKILSLLTSNARIAVSDIARQIGLSPPSVHVRLKDLEQRGIVRGYHADILPEAAGITVIAFIGITTQPFRSDGDRAIFERFFAHSPNVIECHDCSGERDYLVKVVASNNEELRALLASIRQLSGVVSTNTNIVLGSIKEPVMQLPMLDGPTR
jgi:Lrp/AsnC family transcriptional regulator, leucine-responsive regulatory protein